jgi:Caspase domain
MICPQARNCVAAVRRVVAATILFTAMALSVPGYAQDDPLRHGDALIIGTWAYSDARWPRLDDIRLQIDQLRSGLKAHFDAVQVLSNPTFDQLDSGLRRFLRIRGNDENARLLIYYAGHGYTEVDLGRNESRGYITGSDTPYVDGSLQGFAAARARALSMEAIRGMVSDVNARHLLFIFDSCFAGTVSPPALPQENSDASLRATSQADGSSGAGIHHRR